MLKSFSARAPPQTSLGAPDTTEYFNLMGTGRSPACFIDSFSISFPSPSTVRPPPPCFHLTPPTGDFLNQSPRRHKTAALRGCRCPPALLVTASDVTLLQTTAHAQSSSRVETAACAVTSSMTTTCVVVRRCDSQDDSASDVSLSVFISV